MSWDFGMKIDAGGVGLVDLQYGAYYTYNVSPMYYDAFETEDGIRVLDGLSGLECQRILENAIQNFKNKKEEYKKMNPENGWGNYEGALELLHKLLVWCIEAPNAIMIIS